MLTFVGKSNSNSPSASATSTNHDKQHDNNLEFQHNDNKLTFLDVVRILKTKRRTVLNNVWFLRQLAEYAQSKNPLGPKPTAYSDVPIPESEFSRMATATHHGRVSADPWA